MSIGVLPCAHHGIYNCSYCTNTCYSAILEQQIVDYQTNQIVRKEDLICGLLPSPDITMYIDNQPKNRKLLLLL